MLSDFTQNPGFLPLMTGAGFAIWLLWQMDESLWHRPKGNEARTLHGTARWGKLRDLKRRKLLNPKGLIIGKQGRRLVRVATDSHLLTLAPTRSGKGVSSIIPNLLTYEGSMVVVDPKGENAAICARRRRELGQSVQVLDPFGVSGLPSARLNPLDSLRPESVDLLEDATLLADALVQNPAGSTQEPFWSEEARALLTGLIIYVVCCEPPEKQNLGQLRHVLSLDGATFEAFCEALATHPQPQLSRLGRRLLQKSDRELSGVLSTAQSHTHFLESKRMGAVLEGSSFKPGQLKTSAMTLFLVLPAERLESYSRWLRLMLTLLLAELARTPGKPEKPVLFILDEFPALGRLELIETAMGLMAGYGVQLWPIVQDLSQLQGIYREKWRNFLANAGVIQAFNVTEPGTAEFLSKMLGTRTAMVSSWSGGRSHAGEHVSVSQGMSTHSAARPLLLPDEVVRLPADQQLVFVRGVPPLRLSKLRYFAERAFQGLYDANPLRKLARRKERKGLQHRKEGAA